MREKHKAAQDPALVFVPFIVNRTVPRQRRLDHGLTPSDLAKILGLLLCLLQHPEVGVNKSAILVSYFFSR